jgi:hypothetical protein
MNPYPTIALGQQPNGFFPKRYFFAKLQTAKNLQKQIGGKIALFYHDSDADYRETITVMVDKNTNAEVRLNFTQENKIQKNFSPLYLKRIPSGWREEILKQLPRFVDQSLIEIFKSVDPAISNPADFCLEIYKKMGLLEGVEIYRSSSPRFRQDAAELNGEYFADVTYENEIVRAQLIDGKLKLHQGGGKYIEVPFLNPIEKLQKTPGRDQRFLWMNSVIGATHYITGNSEYEYLKREDFPEVNFIKRDQIENPELAWIPFKIS